MIKYIKKLSNYTDYLISGILILMIVSVLITWIILPYQGMADNRVKIYGIKKINIEKVTNLLSQSSIKGNQSVHVFVVPRWLMLIINPIQGLRVQGFNYPIMHFVFANEETNIDTARTVEGLIVHETTHTDIQQKFGLKTLFYDNWKIEGVCDYISKETSIYSNQMNEILKKYHNKENLSGKEKYFIYKVQVEKLINQGKTIEQIIMKENEPKV